jgi:replicative DNA helicase
MALNLTPVRPANDDSRTPANLEAEQAVLGVALLDNSAIALLEDLKPGHFYEPFHGRLWAAITERLRTGRLADPITLRDHFAADPAFSDLGGVAYLADLIDRAPPSYAAPQYAAVIADLAMRRELIALANDTAAQAADIASGQSAEAVIASLERGAAEIAKGSTGSDHWQPAGEMVAAALRDARERNGQIEISTGLASLDALTGGFRRGELAVIAGRPAMGKSTAGLAVAKAVARAGKGVCFFSMEMAEGALAKRMASDVALDRYRPNTRVPYFLADRGQLTSAQWHILGDAADEIATWPLAFDTRPGQTPAQMEAKARRQFRKWQSLGIEPGCVVVDHLTIAATDNDRRGNRVAEVGDISRGLAEMAKRLDVPVVALCQLSRDVEKREGNRPGLSDLRWSGEIEQDARLIAFLWRPEYYLKADLDGMDERAALDHEAKRLEVQNKLFWLVEKNNNGATGQVETYCDMPCNAIRDLAA